MSGNVSDVQGTDSERVFSAAVVSGRKKSSIDLVERVGPAFQSLPNSSNFVPGTLNLLLAGSFLLKESKSLWRDWSTQFRVWPAELNGKAVFIVRWKRCRGHVIEVISDSYLRGEFGLKDGDRVTLTVRDSLVEDSNLWKKLWFFIFWYRREHLFYQSEIYPKVVGIPEVVFRVLQK